MIRALLTGTLTPEQARDAETLILGTFLAGLGIACVLRAVGAFQ